MTISLFRLRRLAMPLVAAVMLALAPAAAAKTTTVKLKSGTTKLAFDAKAIQNLTAMGIAVSPVAPTTAAGPVLSFRVRGGTLKVKGAKRKKATGQIRQDGGMTLASATYSVAMNKPAVVLGATGSTMAANVTLAGTTPVGIMTMADLDLSKMKVTLTSKRVQLSRVAVHLNTVAAGSMNTFFGVNGFTPGFAIGTATVRADIKR